MLIQTHEWHAEPKGIDVPETMISIRRLVSRLVRVNPAIRGLQVRHADGALVVRLRVAGMDRWKLAQEGRKIAKLIFSRHKIASARLHLVSTEPNRRDLMLGEGRTEATYRGRWERVGWWGDELP